MSSDAFMNGFSIVAMLQMFFNSGAMFNISPSSVHVVPPVLGSSLADIVPPVIIIAMFGNFLFCSNSGLSFFDGVAFSNIVASRISFSLIPIL